MQPEPVSVRNVDTTSNVSQLNQTDEDLSVTFNAVESQRNKDRPTVNDQKLLNRCFSFGYCQRKIVEYKISKAITRCEQVLEEKVIVVFQSSLKYPEHPNQIWLGQELKVTVTSCNPLRFKSGSQKCNELCEVKTDLYLQDYSNLLKTDVERRTVTVGKLMCCFHRLKSGHNSTIVVKHVLKFNPE